MVNFQGVSLETEKANDAIGAAIAYLDGDDYDDDTYIVRETDDGLSVLWGETAGLEDDELITQYNKRGVSELGGVDVDIFVIEGTEDELRDAAE
jgi:hypothetical protein